MTSYTFDASDIFEDIPNDPANVLMKIPEEVCKDIGIAEGDVINISARDGAIIISKHE